MTLVRKPWARPPKGRMAARSNLILARTGAPERAPHHLRTIGAANARVVCAMSRVLSLDCHAIGISDAGVEGSKAFFCSHGPRRANSRQSEDYNQVNRFRLTVLHQIRCKNDCFFATLGGERTCLLFATLPPDKPYLGSLAGIAARRGTPRRCSAVVGPLGSAFRSSRRKS